MRVARARQPVEQAGDPIGLKAEADHVELLAALVHHAAGAADVVQLLGEFQQRQLAPSYLLLRGQLVLLSTDGIRRIRPEPRQAGWPRPRGAPDSCARAPRGQPTVNSIPSQNCPQWQTPLITPL